MGSYCVLVWEEDLQLSDSQGAGDLKKASITALCEKGRSLEVPLFILG